MDMVYEKINGIINIDPERQKFSQNFMAVKDTIFKKLHEGAVFHKLSKGHSLEGSYGDNLKVKSPNEFDLVFRLELPASKYIIVRKDLQHKGNVVIDLTNVLEEMKKHEHHKREYDVLNKWTNEEKLLLVNKILSWLQGCFGKVLNALNNEIKVGNHRSKLKYEQSGPAHTIYVTGEGIEYSIDFVPSISLKVRSEQPVQDAIPKPFKPKDNAQVSFRASYYAEEKLIIDDRKNLKNSLRIMKKFRDAHQNIMLLKSYYIKTLFLWKAEESNKKYWESSVSIIMIDMFKMLEEKLSCKTLPFYWDEELNLFQDLSEQNLREIHRCVKSARDILIQANERIPDDLTRIYRIFLTDDEILLL